MNRQLVPESGIQETVNENRPLVHRRFLKKNERITERWWKKVMKTKKHMNPHDGWGHINQRKLKESHLWFSYLLNMWTQRIRTRKEENEEEMKGKWTKIENYYNLLSQFSQRLVLFLIENLRKPRNSLNKFSRDESN